MLLDIRQIEYLCSLLVITGCNSSWFLLQDCSLDQVGWVPVIGSQWYTQRCHFRVFKVVVTDVYCLAQLTHDDPSLGKFLQLWGIVEVWIHTCAFLIHYSSYPFIPPIQKNIQESNLSIILLLHCEVKAWCG